MVYVNPDIAATALGNPHFRRVLETGEHLQLVVMTVPPGEEIGTEVHDGIDQTLVFVSGSGAADLDGETTAVGPGALVLVPAGTNHNVRNTGSEPLALYTLYSPPEHAPGTVHRTKAEADAAEHSS
ncbi:MAG: cupin domain-containing protein [Actinomycetota bacterium]|nr:cupin domain-containing protein [Actinomycetota bacterium]